MSTAAGRRGLGAAVVAGGASWVAARAAVGVAFVVAHLLSGHFHHATGAGAGVPAVTSRQQLAEGLLGWDAGWYRAIAAHGYAGAGHSSLRFFPLAPMLTWLVARIPGMPVGGALLLVANAAALVAGILLAWLAWRETADAGTSRRAAWVLALAPAAFVLAMGYADPVFLALAIATFLALRSTSRGRPRWWLAAGFGFLAGATRPLGVLLVLAAGVEAWRALRASPERAAGPLAATLGPLAGGGSYLLWVAWRYGGLFTPLAIQTSTRHRGAFTDPVVTMFHDAGDLLRGHHVGTGLHLVWVVVAVALCVVCWMRWPASYALFATAVVAVAISAANLDSFERYALSAFPLVLAAGGLLGSRRRWAEPVVLVALGAVMAGYCTLALLNAYVP